MGIFELFPHLSRAVWKTHEQAHMTGTGHDFDHALRVGQVAFMISETEEMGRLAGAAGLCHNADRILQKMRGLDHRTDVPQEEAVEMVRAWLMVEPFSRSDQELIIDAFLHHSGLNRPDSSPVLVALQDADRIVCSDAETIMTAAQFRPDIPAVDPILFLSDPKAKFGDPRSVLWDIHWRFRWLDPTSPSTVRLPKAKKMMQERLEFITLFIGMIRQQRAAVGLVPYPADLAPPV